MGLSYTITIGNNSDNISKVNKQITAVKSDVVINPKEMQNILKPVFVIDYDSTLINCNYVTTSFTNYQYFIDSISINTGGRMVLNCSIDPLSGFDFSECPITVVRSESTGINKITDNKLPILPNEETLEQIPINDSDNSFNTTSDTKCYILQCIGGVNT